MTRALLSAMVMGMFVLAVVPLEGQAGQEKSGSRPGAPVRFVAHDHGYAGPDRIPAGLTMIEIANEGRDLHHAQIVRLAAGRTAEDFVSALKADPTHWPGWVSFVGGPNGIVPGDRATAAMRLDPGSYLVLCLIPDKQGVPHVMLGMHKPLTVLPATRVAFDEPASDLRITQRDFHFDLSQPITAGTHTIHVSNHGSQPHEVLVVQLAPGATVKDFVAAFEPGASGPPPGKPVGGIVGLDSGGRGYFTATFVPGHYALMCFLPDQRTGKEHLTQGMVSEFTVK